ncbi:DUF4365 domain-containing protein [Micromonospora sp. WMMD723]|uniref:DUF4365 domain-containing protein n=1 Tax=Micromonospora sp. WMMD723 TaxID=3403465 RepID=UPI003CE90538
MSRTKRRVTAHIRDDEGIKIVRSKLPAHWVVREITPDYGLDLHIEVFEPDVDGAEHADAYGEHLFAQVKTTSSVSAKRLKVQHRRNVEKGRLQYDETSEEEEIEVVRQVLETSELRTVESMGSAIPVLLLVVDESAREVYFVCLNDYISKVLTPENARWRSQASSTIRIPAFNRLDYLNSSFSYIRLLARRAKLLSAFLTFGYQRHEYNSAINKAANLQGATMEAVRASDVGDMLQKFFASDLALDIWETAGPGTWRPLVDVHQDLRQCFAMLQMSANHVSAAFFLSQVWTCFSRAENLGRMYEELCREWRLPTALAAMIEAIEAAERPENSRSGYSPPATDTNGAGALQAPPSG